MDAKMDPKDDLVASILRATSGSPCRAAEERLPDLVDDEVLILPSGTRVWRDPGTKMIMEEHPVGTSAASWLRRTTPCWRGEPTPSVRPPCAPQTRAAGPLGRPLGALLPRRGVRVA